MSNRDKTILNFLPPPPSVPNGFLRACTYAVKIDFNPFPNKPWFLHVCSISLSKTLCEKGKNAHNEQFLLFPSVFSTCFENFLPFSSKSVLSSANSFSLEESKICRLEKGLADLIILGIARLWKEMAQISRLFFYVHVRV